MATYYVKVMRIQGALPAAEELLAIEAESRDRAYKLSLIKSTLTFKGQERKTFIKAEGEGDFTEYRDPRY